MHQFEYFSRFAAFWFWNDDEKELPPVQEVRHSTWFSGFGKETRRISGTAGFADEA